MKPALFHHVMPDSLDAAIAALSEGGGAILAGGQSLLPAMNFRLASPSMLVDISGIGELARLTVTDASVNVGAMVRHRDVECDARVARSQPLLLAALAHVAHVPIRNRGTLVGSLCHADAAAELPLVLVLTDGHVVAHGPAGCREIAAADFFRFHLTTSRADDEIVVEARFPVLPETAGWAFDEVARRRGDFALAAVGAIVVLDESGHVASIALAAGGISDKPIRLSACEAMLAGKQPDKALIEAVAAASEAFVTAPDDMHASTETRAFILANLIRSVLAQAVERARAARAGKDN